MIKRWLHDTLTWLRRTVPWLQRAGSAVPLSVERRAQDLIAAVDAGGIPLNPARVNDIARGLGLEVSRHDPVEATLDRIRQSLKRRRG